jgi:flagellar assembly protein FliH
MSSRAQRVAGGAAVRRFDWHASGSTNAEPPLYIVGDARSAEVAQPAVVPEPATVPMDVDAHLATLEREAFAKGYAAGERAGVEAGARRADAMLRRLAETLERLSQLRRTIIQQTEQQVVELAVTLARRVVTREISLDPQLVAALAHVALERLGEQAPATIRLHPDDYAAVAAQRGEAWEGAQVSIVPDAAVARGGCQVESDFGLIDAGVHAQLDELSRALLSDVTTAPAAVVAHAG